jgi:hypothetical protein
MTMYKGKHIKRFDSKRLLLNLIPVFAGVLFLPMAFSANAEADGTLNPLELAMQTKANCQVLLANATSSAQRTRANNCITDQNLILRKLTSPTAVTPSTSPSSSPSPSPTTSPTPTPTTSSSPPPSSNNCQNNLAACGLPNEANTGPGGSLTIVNGDVSINTSGVYSNKEVHGCIEVHANDVTISNVKVVGNGCFYGVRNFNSNLHIEDSYISCGGNGTGVTSDNFTVLRTEIVQCENGFNVAGNVTVQDSYVHNMITANGAHTDGAQFNQGAGNIVFRHNTLIIPAPGGTSAIIMWDEGNPQNHDVTIQSNLLAGGTYTLYCPRMNASNINILDNRFGDYEYGQSNGCTPGHVTQWSGNVNDGNGSVYNP